MNIQIVNVGLGNVASIQNMLRKIGCTSSLSTTPDPNAMADLIILPGVGAYDTGMMMLEKHGWSDYLKEFAHQPTTRILGICLGMQLLCEGSEEGDRPGLGFIPGYFKRFKPDVSSLKVPHMGWNTVEFRDSRYLPFPIHGENPRFYFVHSYYYSAVNDNFVSGWCNYGKKFGAVIDNKSVTGVQFHPEKSHRFGMQFFRNYINSICLNTE